MNVEGTLPIARTPDRVLAHLRDPAALQRILPACQSVEQVGPDRFRARVARSLGPVALRVEPDLTLTAAADGSHLLTIDASSFGIGSLGARVILRLHPEAPGTRLSWQAEITTTGLLRHLMAERQHLVGARVEGLFQSLKAIAEADVA